MVDTDSKARRHERNVAVKGVTLSLLSYGNDAGRRHYRVVHDKRGLGWLWPERRTWPDGTYLRGQVWVYEADADERERSFLTQREALGSIVEDVLAEREEIEEQAAYYAELRSLPR